MRRLNLNFLIMLIFFLGFWGTMIFPSSLPQSSAASINISHPASKTHVAQYGEHIEFRSNSSISNDYVPVVFIKDPLNQWWPWLQSSRVDGQGKHWMLNNVQYGISSNRGLEFQIQVLVIPRQDLDNGVVLEEDKRLFIEAGEPIRNSIYITVLRDRYPSQSNVVKVIRR